MPNDESFEFSFRGSRENLLWLLRGSVLPDEKKAPHRPVLTDVSPPGQVEWSSKKKPAKKRTTPPGGVRVCATAGCSNDISNKHLNRRYCDECQKEGQKEYQRTYLKKKRKKEAKPPPANFKKSGAAYSPRDIDCEFCGPHRHFHSLEEYRIHLKNYHQLGASERSEALLRAKGSPLLVQSPTPREWVEP
jgi:hypothetical protein